MAPFSTQPTEQWLYRSAESSDCQYDQNPPKLTDDIFRHINDPEPQLCLRGIEYMHHQTKVATKAAEVARICS